MSHTPGPWSWDDEGDLMARDGVPVVQTNHRTSLVTEEDKALLAAAPEMLVLLREFSDEVLSYDGSPAPNGYESMERVLALLKRLEGV